MKSYRTMCKKTWAVILAIACHLPATWATNANEIEIIPKPVHVEQTSGNFRLSPKSTIGYDAALQGQAEYLQQVLGQSTGWDLKLKKDAPEAKAEPKKEKVESKKSYKEQVSELYASSSTVSITLPLCFVICKIAAVNSSFVSFSLKPLQRNSYTFCKG